MRTATYPKVIIHRLGDPIVTRRRPVPAALLVPALLAVALVVRALCTGALF